MFPVLEIGAMLLRTFAWFIVHPFFWLVGGIAFFQYLRISRMEEKLFGLSINNLWEQTIKSMLLGLVGGILASVILVFLGLSIDRIGIAFIWPIAILLLLVNPRFLCFAYAGGIVAVIVFFAEILAQYLPTMADGQIMEMLLEIHLPGLLVLVAVLHLIESLLIYIGGHWGSSPVYFKSQSGEIVGGFSLQRFWPLPLVGMIALLEPQTSEMFTNGVSMPDWWPILNSGLEPAGNESILYLLIPVIAGLGYADMALSSTPRGKCICTARYLSIYSVILLGLGLLSEFYPIILLPACLFAPLGHEIVVVLGNQLEFYRPLRYRSTSGEGAKVLSIFPDSAAKEAGLETGDVIKRVNGEKVLDNQKFWEQISDSYFLVHLTVKREGEDISMVLKKNGGLKYQERLSKSKKLYPGQPPSLGLILVPDTATPVYMEARKVSPIGSLKKKILDRRV